MHHVREFRLRREVRNHQEWRHRMQAWKHNPSDGYVLHISAMAGADQRMWSFNGSAAGNTLQTTVFSDPRPDLQLQTLFIVLGDFSWANRKNMKKRNNWTMMNNGIFTLKKTEQLKNKKRLPIFGEAERASRSLSSLSAADQRRLESWETRKRNGNVGRPQKQRPQKDPGT